MSEYFAIHDGITVINCIRADRSFIDATLSDGQVAVDVTSLPQRPGPDWTVEGNGFRAPAPYPSWVWDGEAWEAPVPRPTEPGAWVWDENAQEWIDPLLPTE